MPYDRHTGKYISPEKEKETPRLETPYHCEKCGTRVDGGYLLTDDTAPRWCEEHSIKTYSGHPDRREPYQHGGGCCFPAGTLVAISFNPANQAYDSKNNQGRK